MNEICPHCGRLLLVPIAFNERLYCSDCKAWFQIPEDLRKDLDSEIIHREKDPSHLEM